MKDFANEGSAIVILVTFYDPDNVPVVPSTVRYSIHDYETNAPIRENIEVTELASTIGIEILPSDNTITNNNLHYEKKVLTVEANYDTDNTENSEYFYWVKNLKYWS